MTRKRLTVVAWLLALGTGGVVGTLAQEAPAVELRLSELDKAQLDLLDLREQLRVARAQRADCEATLGPIEAQARGAEIQRVLEQLKKDIEGRHPGAEFDPMSGTLKKKPKEK